MAHCIVKIGQCKDRFGAFPVCCNRDCSVSALPGSYPLAEMVNSVVVTSSSSSSMVQALDKNFLKPSKWNLDGKWQRAAA
jgi:hypothetical protein